MPALARYGRSHLMLLDEGGGVIDGSSNRRRNRAR